MTDAILTPKAHPLAESITRPEAQLMLGLVEDIERPTVWRPWIPEAVGLLTTMHRDVLREATARLEDPVHAIRSLEGPHVVDFGSLPWTDIAELRRNEFLADFRDRLTEIEEADGNASGELWRDMWETIGESVPNVDRHAC